MIEKKTEWSEPILNETFRLGGEYFERQRGRVGNKGGGGGEHAALVPQCNACVTGRGVGGGCAEKRGRAMSIYIGFGGRNARDKWTMIRL